MSTCAPCACPAAESGVGIVTTALCSHQNIHQQKRGPTEVSSSKEGSHAPEHRWTSWGDTEPRSSVCDPTSVEVRPRQSWPWWKILVTDGL